VKQEASGMNECKCPKHEEKEYRTYKRRL
jgi:hypothetical protein